MSNHKVILSLHIKHIQNTGKESIVQVVRAFLCHLTSLVKKEIGVISNNTYINTRVLKHVYDKRPAEEYDFLIQNVHTIVKYPDSIYKNKDSKKGDYCFIKLLKSKKYLCSLGVINDGEIKGLEVATFFRLNKENYLNNYELLWSWKDDKSSS